MPIDFFFAQYAILRRTNNHTHTNRYKKKHKLIRNRKINFVKRL